MQRSAPKFSPTQIEALLQIKDGQWHQVHVSSTRFTRRPQASGSGWLRATMQALHKAGAIRMRSFRGKETERGVTTSYLTTDAQITDEGLAELARLGFR